LRYNYMNRIDSISCFFIVFFLISLLSIKVVTGTNGAPPETVVSATAENIHTVSDKMVFDGNRRMAELIGNVKVSQGGTIINADKIKIFYREGNYSQNSMPANDESIEKIFAKGNVRIELESGKAFSEQATYLADQKLLILSGTNARFTSGENTISGSKIIVNRENGRVTFESTDKKPVEAVIFSNEQL